MSQELNFRSHPIDHLCLRGNAQETALITKRGTLTYDELEGAIGRLARLLTSYGFEDGDRIASWLPKNRLACLLPLAAVRAKLVYVPVNPLLKRAQLSHIVHDSGARLLITQLARFDQLEEGDLPAQCHLGDEAEFESSIDKTGNGLPPSAALPDTLAAILYTSGSTGKPKGVMLSHHNLWLGAQSVATYLRLLPDDKILAVLPLSFDYGQNQLFSTWYAGGAVIPLDYLTPRDVVSAVRNHRITTLAGVPPLWVQLVEQSWDRENTASLRRVTNSGGALTPTLVKKLRTVFPDADIYAMYGLTEAFRSTFLDPDLIDSHPDSMGKAIPFAEILVVDSSGQITADNEPGELVHAGPLVAQGYWRDPARTGERFRKAPLASAYGGTAVWSGDTVRRDRDGLLYFISRDDAMIKSAGNRISPSEIEEAAVASGIVNEAVALGLPDPRLGEAIVLIVGGASGKSADEEASLRAHLKTELPNFMQPSTIHWFAQLPRNPNGKFDRVAIAQALREEAKP